MTRIPTDPDSKTQPRIDPNAVLEFFEQRARKIDVLGPVRAVIYQDKHPDLAEQRDAAEKNLIAPLLLLDGTQRVADIGCGTGRWLDRIAENCSAYHGVDASAGLIEHARLLHAGRSRCRFSTLLANHISLKALGETEPFDRILCAGLMIYLNDDDLLGLFAALQKISAESCRIVIREPVGLLSRLTIKDHYSDDMEQTYNAIYRTENELIEAMHESLLNHGFKIKDKGDVYTDHALNNRHETRQRWLVLERGQ